MCHYLFSTKGIKDCNCETPDAGEITFVFYITCSIFIYPCTLKLYSGTIVNLHSFNGHYHSTSEANVICLFKLNVHEALFVGKSNLL